MSRRQIDVDDRCMISLRTIAPGTVGLGLHLRDASVWVDFPPETALELSQAFLDAAGDAYGLPPDPAPSAAYGSAHVGDLAPGKTVTVDIELVPRRVGTEG